MLKVAGWSLVGLAALHLVLLGSQNLGYLGAWFSGALWGLPWAEFVAPSGASAGFWISVGSFGFPLLLLGALIVSLARRGIRVPAGVGWGLAAWSLVAGIILEPSPMLLALVPAVLVILAARKSHASEIEKSAAAVTQGLG